MRQYRASRGKSLGLAAMGGLLITAPALGHVQLDDPNGGETLLVGSVFTIEWHILIFHNQLNWDLWYSTTSNGGPWTCIAEDLPPGSTAVGSVHTYDWTVPDVVDSSVWVRVRMDNAGTDYEDASDQSFEIVSPAPANDDCDNASLAGVGSHAFSNENASLDGFDEFGNCGFNPSPDIWFRLFATCDGDLVISLTDLTFDAALAVYTGIACPTGPDQAIACIEAPGETSVSVPVTLGQALHIRIGNSEGIEGTGTLNIACEEPVDCPADTNGSGTVDTADLLGMLAAWGTADPTYDIAPKGGDGTVSVADLLFLLSSWGDCP